MLISTGARPTRRRPLFFIGSSKKDLRALPDDVKDVFGQALLDVQYGNTYRAVYTVEFADVVYVLDVFMKKARTGIATPRVDKQRVRARFRAARAHYHLMRGITRDG